MTKKKLLEFYNKVTQEKISIYKIRQIRNCSDSQVETIINSKYLQVMMDIVTNHEFNLLSKKDQAEVINIVNNAQNEQIATGIYHIVASGMILSSGLTIKILNILDNSTIQSAPYIINLAQNTFFLINPRSLEIMKIISQSKKEYQISYASDIIKNIDSLMNNELIEIIKLAIKTEGEEQCKLVNAMAKNRDVLAFDLAVELITLASKTKKDKESIELMISVASNKLLDKYRYSTQYLVMMLGAKTPEEILKIYNEAEQKIINLKIQESKLQKDNELFWNAYRYRPTNTIQSLDMFESYEDITPYTRIRKRKENNE